jgi:hypothetical protein
LALFFKAPSIYRKGHGLLFIAIIDALLLAEGAQVMGKWVCLEKNSMRVHLGDILGAR